MPKPWDFEKGPRWCLTLIEAETLSGTVEQVGSVHMCLHGDAGKMVHFRVAYDGTGRRFTDKLSNVPVVGKMIQTGEAKPSASGTKFTLYYSLDPAVPVADEETRSVFLDAVGSAPRMTSGALRRCAKRRRELRWRRGLTD